LLIGAFVLGTLSVLLSASRGGYLVLVAVVLYALLALRFRFVRGLRVGGTLLMIVAALLLASRLNLSFVPGLARGTAQAVAQVATGKSSEARVRIVQHGLRAWAGHPVFGVGLGVGPDVGAYSGNPLRGTASHSTYLTALVETGVVGFVLFCALLLTTWSNLSQRLPAGRASGHRHVELNWAWRAVFLGFLMMSLSGNLIFDKVLWVTIGMSIVFRKRPDILTEPAPERE
jgi:O-antigen ligase